VFNDSEIVEVRPRRSRQTVLQILAAIAAQNQALEVGRGIVTAASMLNRVLGQARRLALHDAVVIIISDFDGADQQTRGLVGALAQHNDVIAFLVHDPLQSDLPASASMSVTNGELQILLEVGRDSVRKNITAAVQQRLGQVFAWTPELGIPVLPLSAAEATPPQLARLLGRLPVRQGRGGTYAALEAALG
jgi:uncharacterized protein (DUF58 family)